MEALTQQPERLDQDSDRPTEVTGIRRKVLPRNPESVLLAIRDAARHAADLAAIRSLGTIGFEGYVARITREDVSIRLPLPSRAWEAILSGV